MSKRGNTLRRDLRYRVSMGKDTWRSVDKMNDLDDLIIEAYGQGTLHYAHNRDLMGIDWGHIYKHVLGHTNHYEAMTEAGELWLLVNTPEGADIIRKPLAGHC